MLRIETKTHDRLLVLCCCAILGMSFCVLVLACGGSGGPVKGPGLPTQIVKDAAAAIDRSATSIDAQTKAIVEEAPATKPHTDLIGDETAKLRAVSDELDKATLQLAESAKAYAALSRELTQAKGDLGTLQVKYAKLKAEHNSAIMWALAGLAFFAVVGAALCVWGGSFKSAGFFALLFGLAISGEYLLEWAKWIALGVLVCLAVMAVYLFVIRHKSLTEVIRTAENWKPKDIGGVPEGAKELANGIQSATTKKLVTFARKKLGVA